MAIYTVDSLHSNIQFKVKHLMITTVTGEFKEYSGQIETEDFGQDTKVDFEIKVDSIMTGNEQRDAHLKSDDFFSSEKYPNITFKSTSVVRDGDDIEVIGDLTIRDVTKKVTFKGTYEGSMVDFYGMTKVGFELEGKIKRKEFGLQWDAVTEAGGVVVSDDVKMALQLQLTKVSSNSQENQLEEVSQEN